MIIFSVHEDRDIFSAGIYGKSSGRHIKSKAVGNSNGVGLPLGILIFLLKVYIAVYGYGLRRSVSADDVVVLWGHIKLAADETVASLNKPRELHLILKGFLAVYDSIGLQNYVIIAQLGFLFGISLVDILADSHFIVARLSAVCCCYGTCGVPVLIAVSYIRSEQLVYKQHMACRAYRKPLRDTFDNAEDNHLEYCNHFILLLSR